MDDMKSPEGPSALSQWYMAFHEIPNVRRGTSSNPGVLARLERIMLKLVYEKKSYNRREEWIIYLFIECKEIQLKCTNLLNKYYPLQYSNGPLADHPPMHVELRKQTEMRNLQMQCIHSFEEHAPPIKGMGRR